MNTAQVWLQASILGAALAALGWGVVAGPLRIASRASSDFLGLNLFVLAGCLSWWPWPMLGGLPGSYQLAVGLVLSLAGVQWLCTGLQVMYDLKPSYVTSPMMLPMLAATLVGVAWLDSSGQGVLLAFFSAATWMLSVSVQQAFPSVLAQRGRRVARWSLFPLLVAALVWVAGMVRAVWLLLWPGDALFEGTGALALIDNWQLLGLHISWWVLNAALGALLMLKLLDKIRDLSTEDELTGALNLRSFMAMLNAERDRMRRHPSPQTLMVCELDQLHALNKQLGFAAGDAALRQVTTVVGRGLRKTDRLGRSMDAEFLLFLPDTPTMGAMLVAERMQAALKANPLLWNGQAVGLTLSMGISGRNDADTPCEDMVALSRQGVQRAQREGGGRIRVSQREAANDSTQGPLSTR